MAETIWNTVVMVFHFIMKNIVIINILLSLIIVFFEEDHRRQYGPGCFCFILFRLSDLFYI